MKNTWIRFGCFLTGYNYNILRGCSEAAFKAVKKYAAAMVIVCILWFFIGFTFAQRYLQVHAGGCLLAGAISVVIIIQIEKQIILSINPGKLLLVFRCCLAIMMSILGAVIIDQILLEKDIETEKVSYIAKKVSDLLPLKTEELRNQIRALDSSIAAKEEERLKYISEPPTIHMTSSQTQMSHIPVKLVDRFGRDSTGIISKPTTTTTTTEVPNPKSALVPKLDTTISEMRTMKTSKENILLNIRPSLEKELSDKIGFLDELKVMVQLISGSMVAFSFWLLWILFFFFIEMLVLVSKMGDKESDYEKAVIHHLTLRVYRLNALAAGLRADGAIR